MCEHPHFRQTPSLYIIAPESPRQGRTIARSCHREATRSLKPVARSIYCCGSLRKPFKRRVICFASFCFVLFRAQRLREELKEIALKRCDDSVAEFAACAREKGMLVVFSCREKNKASKSANRRRLL